MRVHLAIVLIKYSPTLLQTAKKTCSCRCKRTKYFAGTE